MAPFLNAYTKQLQHMIRICSILYDMIYKKNNSSTNKGQKPQTFTGRKYQLCPVMSAVINIIVIMIVMFMLITIIIVIIIL